MFASFSSLDSTIFTLLRTSYFLKTASRCFWCINTRFIVSRLPQSVHSTLTPRLLLASRPRLQGLTSSRRRLKPSSSIALAVHLNALCRLPNQRSNTIYLLPQRISLLHSSFLLLIFSSWLALSTFVPALSTGGSSACAHLVYTRLVVTGARNSTPRSTQT